MAFADFARENGESGGGPDEMEAKPAGDRNDGYARILVATDGSKCSMHAAEHAVYLAEKLGARLFAVNVVNVERAFHAGIHFGEAIGELEKSGREALEAVEKLAAEKGVECEGIQARGHPHGAIIEVSDGIGADLIVVGSTGMTSIGRILIGSESEKVLRHSSRPVLLVREKVEGAREEAARPTIKGERGTR